MGRQKYTDEQLLLDYLNASNKAGEWLRTQDMGPKTGLAYYQVYLKRFREIINVRKLIIKNFHHLIEFPANTNVARKQKVDKEILETIISQSILAGYKLSSKDIDTNKFLPRYATVRRRLGSIKRIYSLAGKISKDFLELPRSAHRNLISNEERNKRNNIVISKYIEACLEQNCIIHVTKISASKTGFCCRYVYQYFRNIESFRSECAKASPEFAELLARHNQK